MYVYKCNLKYKIYVLLIRLKLKGNFNSQVNVLKKEKNLHGNFVIMFLNASDISFTNFALGGVNGVLHLYILQYAWTLPKPFGGGGSGPYSFEVVRGIAIKGRSYQRDRYVR